MAQNGPSVSRQRLIVPTVTVQEQLPLPAQAQEEAVTLVLRPRKQVSWRDGTVDNEHMQKKSSKICCIYHKKEELEDYSDDDDNAVKENGRCQHDHSHTDDGSGPSDSHGISQDGDGGSHDKHQEANGKRPAVE